MLPRSLILFCLITQSAFGATRVESAVSRIDGGYPWRRYVEGIPSLAYGATTALGGVWIMLDSRHHNNSERTVGALSAVLGGVFFLDSLAVTFGESSGEMMARHYRGMSPNGDGLYPNRDAYAEAAVRRFGDSSRTTRWIRGALTLANAAPYFYFYFSNQTRYRNAQYMGAGLAAIALYRLLWPSPEESAASVLVGAGESGFPTLALRWSL